MRSALPASTGSHRSIYSRRNFLRSTLAVTGVMLAPPLWLSPAARGANNRIGLGAIGLGGRGQYVLGAFLAHADVRVLAVCDVEAARRQAAKRRVDEHYGSTAAGGCAAYRDLRELLARPDIDAVLIATGDNWHALASVWAARAGKDIYCEKPMSVTIAEGRAVVEAVRRHARVFQCGTQRRSIGRFRFAAELARSGRLGQLRTLVAERAPMDPELHERTLAGEPEPDPEVFDWDLWLGPAAWRPYNRQIPTRAFWAAHLDFSGGAITEWGSHTVDLCQMANGTDLTGPVEFEPEADTVVARYANGVKLVFPKGAWPLHVKFEGTEGSVYVDDDGNLETSPASLRERRDFGRGYPADDHVRNFLDCVRSRQQPVSHAEIAHRSNTICQVANICRRLGRPLRWSPDREEFDGDAEANRLRSRVLREPWVF